MKPERWRQIEHLYHAALERASAERMAFLDAACDGDQYLRQEVESLLAYDERAQNFIDTPPLTIAAEMVASEQLPALVGSSVGHYQILSHLGRGGMGEVYLAQDITLGRKIALKLLPEQFTKDSEQVRRFEREAYAASATNHPNILTIYEIGHAEGMHFIATEFVDGVTLRQRMQDADLSIAETFSVAAQIVSALAAAHEAGIVHRDIKPENVMVRRDGLVKVLDFGLAKLAERPLATSQALTMAQLSTEPGVVMGTVSYMSPEQARGLKVDHRTDIFSLGVVLYEMLAGRRPFEGATTSDVLAAILITEPVPLEEHRNDAGPELSQPVMRCLAKDRDERFQTIGEFAAALRAATRYGEQQPLIAARQSPRGEAINHKRCASLRPRFVWIASALALLIVAALAYWKLQQKAVPDPPIKSLAVLPLENLSGDPSQEYFADGMTDALIGDLAKIRALRVISRTSAMYYKGTKKTLPEIASELKVDAVVEGAVLRSGDRVRLRARLIRATTERHLWAESYDYDLRDTLALQSQVTRAIAREIQIKISPDEQGRLTNARPVNRKAYNDYLLGVYYWNKRTEEHVRRAIDYFQSAIREDPSYALAYAGLADCYSVIAVVFGDPGEFAPKAKAAAVKALEIDGTLAEVRAVLASVIAQYDWDWEDAEREFNRAIELNPASPMAHLRYSLILAEMGRMEESLAESKRALDLDPVSLMVNTGLGQRLYNARQYDQAIDQLRRTLELDPNFLIARIALGRVYTQKRRYAESLTELNRAVELSRESGLAELGYVYAVSGQRKEARQILAELLDLSRQRYVSPVDIALIHAGLGEKDQAFDWLGKAYSEHSTKLIHLKMDPRFDILRAEPRFNDLLRRTGLA